MLRPIAGVAEGLAAARILASVWLFPCMGPEMRRQVLQARVRLEASLEL